MGYRRLDEFPRQTPLIWRVISWALENLFCRSEIDDSNPRPGKRLN